MPSQEISYKQIQKLENFAPQTSILFLLRKQLLLSFNVGTHYQNFDFTISGSSSFSYYKTDKLNQGVFLFWLRHQVTGNINTVSLTHGTKSHATLSEADAFRKLLNDKSEISFNHVYFN